MFYILILFFFSLTRVVALEPMTLDLPTEYWDCSNFTLAELEDNTETFFCEDKKSIFVHASKLGASAKALGFHNEDIWVQLEFGKISSTDVLTSPLTSCLSGVKGELVTKTLLLTDSFAIGATGAITFALFGVRWLSTSTTFNAGIAASVDRQMEYGCNAEAGGIVQMLAATTDYHLLEWKLRPVVVSEENTTFGEWYVLPDFTYREEGQQVACVTDPKLLTCDDF